MKVITTILFWCVSAVALAGNPVWIDVRSAEEFNTGHLDAAVNIPHNQVAEKVPGIVAEKNTAILLYCRSGNRAGIAKGTLEALGYTNVKNIGGLEDARKYLAKSLPAPSM